MRRLLIGLSAYLAREPVGHILTSPADISFGPDTLVQPDIFVIPLDQARTLEWSKIQRLLLVAEVLSPSSVRADRFTTCAFSSSRSASLGCEPRGTAPGLTDPE